MLTETRNIVLFTSQDVGYQLVEFLATRSDVSVLVVTQRTRREEIYGYRSAVEACKAHNIPYILSERIDEPTKARIRTHAPELIISAYYPVKIPSDVVAMSSGDAVNIHPGILPHYRGRYPTPWYILNGATDFGISIHQLDAGIDTGAVLFQKRFPIAPDETGATLYRRTMDEAALMIAENFDALLKRQVKGIEQTGSGSYYGSIEKRFHIDWNQSRDHISRRVRVHAPPYFPAYTFLFNHILLISRVSVIDLPGYSAQGAGRIVQVLPDGRFVVSCNDGCLCIEEFSVAPPFKSGQREMHIQSGNKFD